MLFTNLFCAYLFRYGGKVCHFCSSLSIICLNYINYLAHAHSSLYCTIHKTNMNWKLGHQKLLHVYINHTYLNIYSENVICVWKINSQMELPLVQTGSTAYNSFICILRSITCIPPTGQPCDFRISDRVKMVRSPPALMIGDRAGLDCPNRK